MPNKTGGSAECREKQLRLAERGSSSFGRVLATCSRCYPWLFVASGVACAARWRGGDISLPPPLIALDRVVTRLPTHG